MSLIPPSPLRPAAHQGFPGIGPLTGQETVTAVEDGDDLSQVLPGLLPCLRRFAMSLTRDHHAAEDLVQCACVRGLERRHQLRAGSCARSWMLSIVHSVWLNEIRARRVRQQTNLECCEELTDTLPDKAALDPETHMLQRQVIAAVERLPAAQRAVMSLVAVQGRTYREVAETLSIPIGTVMSRLARARVAIGASLGR